MACKVFHTVTMEFSTKKVKQFGSLSCAVRGQDLYILNVAVVTLPSYDLVTSYGLTRRVLLAALHPAASWYMTNTQSGWHNPRPIKTRISEQNRRAAPSTRHVMRYVETVRTSHRQPCYFCSTERFNNLNKTVRVLGFCGGMAEVTVHMGCEPVLMFTWIHTLLGKAASSLSRADSLYSKGPIHPWGPYIISKLRDPVSQGRNVIPKMNGMLCVSLSYVSCSCSYCGCFEITKHKSGLEFMQSVIKIL
jgi:hypothetical protein